MFRRSSFNFFDLFTDRSFNTKYECFSSLRYTESDRSDIEKGGKILLPPSALEALTRYHIRSPMLFKIKNGETNRISHSGVLEFIAEEGKCYLPSWLMKNLGLDEGALAEIESVELPVASYSKFQPLSVDFLDITNPKAVLENALRNFACLTKGDVIAIYYNKKIYELMVLETKPRDAVTIIECDMNVEFEAPVGYVEDGAAEKDDSFEDVEDVDFAGEGNRLDGKKKKENEPTEKKKTKTSLRGIPDYEYNFGSLRFNRKIVPISDRTSEQSAQAGSHNNQQEGKDDGFYGKGSVL